MDYTPDQRDAIQIQDRNLIVTAGAGSGKTRVLVDRFLALLGANPDWPISALVAITFTEKAAREMRDRVRQTIEARIVKAEADHDLTKLHFWQNHQAAIDSARIGTIHSLCVTILRANAAEIGIDPQFSVLDEIDSAILVEEAVERTLHRLVEENHPASRLLIDYDIPDVERVMREQIALPDDVQGYFDTDLLTLRADHDDYINNLLIKLRADSDFNAARTWRPPAWPDKPDKLMPMWDLIHDHETAFVGDQFEGLIEILETWRGQIKLNVGAAAAWGGKEILDNAKAMLRLIRDEAGRVLDEIGAPFGPDDELAAELLPLWGQAIRAAQTQYQMLKTARRALDFDDLESLTRQLLRNPDVAARYRGAEFQHILVDEFQDTNHAQREIVYALSGLDRPGSLFVVGDEKQSIYQFRGADVSVFSQVRSDIIESGGQKITLNTSFRTHDSLVNAFNAIFGELLQRSDHAMSAYEVELDAPMLAVRPAEAYHQAAIELIIIDKNHAENDRNSAEDLRRWEAWELVNRLEKMIHEKTPVWDKQKGRYRDMGYGDIGVLFQASTSMPLLEAVLKARHIPYVTLAGKGYYNQPEVWDLLNLLRALYNPADDLSLAAALHSPLYNLSDDDLLRLRLDTDKSLWDMLNDLSQTEEQVKFVAESLARLHRVAGRVTIAELLTRALEETGYLAAVAGLPGGDRRSGNVEKFIEIARRAGQVGLGAFTEYLRDLTEREVREGEAPLETADAVQLMTVHASKGLEFPVVCLFDTSWEGRSFAPTLLVDADNRIGAACLIRDENGEKIKPFAYRRAQRYLEQRQDAEKLRLLYVGMTRAQDYLIMCGHLSSETTEQDHWLGQLIRTLNIKKLITGPLAKVWGDVRLTVPETQPLLEDLSPRADDFETGWDLLTGAPVPDLDPTMPPLLDSVQIDHQAPARALTATMIASLGESKAIPDIARFRHHVLRDAPVTVPQVATNDKDRLSRRVIGEMVHRALQWGRLPGSEPRLHDILLTYGWQYGLTDEAVLEKAIEEANALLERTERSDITRRINKADPKKIYRELPFVFKFEHTERTIHGIIDVLFYDEEKGWSIVDYKTSLVPGKENLNQRIVSHAGRYHGQIGVYAAAVEALIGETPITYLHYIRYAYTVTIEPAIWQQALHALDSDIIAALAE